MENTMAFRMNNNDCKVLESLAECRILTPTQIASFHQRSKQVVWRRLRILEEQGFIQLVKHEFGRGRGRPERSLGLTETGVDTLKEKSLLDGDMPYEKVTAENIHCVDHQLLLNWFRIHLSQIEKVLPRLSVKVLAHNSPFLPKRPNGRIFLTDYSPVPGSDVQGIRFTPDAVLGTMDSVVPKTCLSFLEVDCGTETIASPRRDMTDVRQKIVNYQAYFRSSKYKRYEKVFKCSLRGFRLLLLTNSIGRLTALCRLTQEMQPSGFIWLTEYGRLLPDGVSAKIWARGGDLQGHQQSILGSLCCRAPLP